MADSKYLDGAFISKKEFPNGGSVINMDIIPDKMIAWLKSAPRTDKGYIKMQIQSKREPELDNFGNVKMFCALNDYFHKPEGAAPSQEQPQNYGGGGTGMSAPNSTTFDDPGADLDIPFACCAI